MHAVVPFELSQLGERVEWRRGTRRVAQSAGLLTVLTGAALMAWALQAHYQAAPRGWVLESWPTREYLLRSGPYRLSRNPMYVAGFVVWLGWAIYYSSSAVWVGLTVLCVVWAKIVQWEERRLLTKFGDEYRAYLAAVPRWVGPGPRSG